jgi:hypothetical protein
MKPAAIDMLGDPVRKPLSNGYAGHVGKGPAGETCGSCGHCRVHRCSSRNYYKCELVPTTFGPGTDIRLSTLACEHWVRE